MLNRLRIQALSTALATDAHLPHALENLGGGLLDSLSIRADGDASKLFDKCPGLIHLRTDALGIGVVGSDGATHIVAEAAVADRRNDFGCGDESKDLSRIDGK